MELKKQALTYMVNHPEKKLFFMLKNAVKFFWVFKSTRNPMEKRINFDYIAIMILAISGFYFTRSRWNDLMSIYLACFGFFIVVVFTHFLNRFRLPVEALFIIMAGYAVHHFYQKVFIPWKKGIASGS